MVKINLYTSAFNLVQNKFDYKDALNNFCQFADRVIVCVNKSTDNTLQELNKLVGAYPNLTIIEEDISYDDPLLDGKIKNAALKRAESFGGPCEIYLGIDLDERIPLKQRERWHDYAEFLLDSKYDGFLIPSINLWGSLETVRWDNEKSRAYKWYLHKHGLHRGPYNNSMAGDFLDIEKTDGTELCSSDGELVNAGRIDGSLDGIGDAKEYYRQLSNFIYVFHLGYANFENRVVRNKNFWSHHWNMCSNRKDVPVVTDTNELVTYNTYDHGLELW